MWHKIDIRLELSRFGVIGNRPVEVTFSSIDIHTLAVNSGIRGLKLKCPVEIHQRPLEITTNIAGQSLADIPVSIFGSCSRLPPAHTARLAALTVTSNLF